MKNTRNIVHIIDVFTQSGKMLKCVKSETSNINISGVIDINVAKESNTVPTRQILRILYILLVCICKGHK